MSEFKDKVIGILNNVQHSTLGFKVNKLADSDRLYLQAYGHDKCTFTGKDQIQYGRKWYLSEHMTTSEIVQTAFHACLKYEEHETRERFKYKGKPIFGPHYNVDVLVDVCNKNNLDYRR